jgi:hypothetical protein
MPQAYQHHSDLFAVTQNEVDRFSNSGHRDQSEHASQNQVGTEVMMQSCWSSLKTKRILKSIQMVEYAESTPSRKFDTSPTGVLSLQLSENKKKTIVTVQFSLKK